jgi:hypothetical protein
VKAKFITKGPQMRAVAVGVALLATAMQAGALVIETDDPDVQLRFDNTIRYNYGVRAQEPNSIVSSKQKSNTSWLQGDVINNRLDVLSEFDYVFQERMGFRISAASWNDQAYKNDPKVSVLSTGKGYSNFANKYYAGPGSELLDAFAFSKNNISDTPVQFKVGRFAEYWGESLFSFTHGSSASQSPVDVAKAYASPGIEAKELFRPQNNISVKFPATDNLSVAIQVGLGWKPYRAMEGGTYFGVSDIASNDSSAPAKKLSGAFPVQTLATVEPDQKDLGLSLRWSPTWLDGTWGFYYRNYADKAGLPAFRSPVATGLPAPYPSAVPSKMQNIFAKDVQLVGTSLSKIIGGTSVGVDLNYRKNQPLVIAGSYLGANTLTAASYASAANDDLIPRGDTWHMLVNAVKLLPRTSFWDSASFAGELAFNGWTKVTQNEKYFSGSSLYTGKDRATKDFHSITASFTPVWMAVMPGVDVAMPITYSEGFGNSAVMYGGNDRVGSYSLGLAFDVDQKHSIKIATSRYFSRLGTGDVGLGSLLVDKGFTSITYKTAF